MTAWRCLEEGPNPAAWNMAVDEAVWLCYPRFRQPTLRLYAWEKPTLSLGRFQSPEAVQWDACAAAGIDLVRRPTGGRAVLHHREVTYSVVAGLDLFPPGVAASYRRLSDALAGALQHLGLSPQLQRKHARSDAEVCFEVPSFAELTLEGKKVCGSAQTRSKDALLQHGSLPLHFPWDLLQIALGLDERLLRRLQGQAGGLCEFASVDERRVRHALRHAFEQHVGPLVPETLRSEERALAQQLAVGKYNRLGRTKEAVHAAGR